MAECGKDSQARVQTREYVDDGDSYLHRLVGSRSGDTHQSADRLNQQVVSGQRRAPVTTESGDRAVHEIWSFRTQLVVSQTEALHRPGPEVLDHDVGLQRDLARTGQIVRIAQVERHRLLVAVDGREIGCGAVSGEWRPPRSRVVARPRTFDLDDVSAEICEQHRRVWPGKHAGEVGDNETVESSWHPIVLG